MILQIGNPTLDVEATNGGVVVVDDNNNNKLTRNALDLAAAGDIHGLRNFSLKQANTIWPSDGFNQTWHQNYTTCRWLLTDVFTHDVSVSRHIEAALKVAVENGPHTITLILGAYSL
jgi:hypothetical protein